MVTAQVEMVNPAWAQKVLDEQRQLEQERGATLNRPVRPRRVADYAREMREGRWQLNGEPIIFNGRRMVDGQHRMHGVVASGVTVPMLVVRGVDETAFGTINQGAARSASDIAAGMGVRTHLSIKTAAARLVMCYDRSGHPPTDSTIRPTPAAVAEHVAINGFAWADAVEAMQEANKVLGTAAALLALSFMVRYRVPERREFFRKLRTGLDVTEFDPARLLRERLISVAPAKGREDTAVRLAWAIKAWNHHVTGEPIRLLKFNLANDVYPEVLR